MTVTFIECESPQAPPPRGNQKPKALVVLAEQPRVPGIRARYYHAMGVVPGNRHELLPGVGINAILVSVISPCPTTASRRLLRELDDFGWQPQPHPKSPLDSGRFVRAQPLDPRSLPSSQAMLHDLAVLKNSTLKPEDISGWLRYPAEDGKPAIACGTWIAPTTPGVAGPCPTGPCLRGGGPCKWAAYHMAPGLDQRAAALDQRPAHGVPPPGARVPAAIPQPAVAPQPALQPVPAQGSFAAPAAIGMPVSVPQLPPGQPPIGMVPLPDGRTFFVYPETPRFNHPQKPAPMGYVQIEGRLWPVQPAPQTAPPAAPALPPGVVPFAPEVSAPTVQVAPVASQPLPATPPAFSEQPAAAAATTDNGATSRRTRSRRRPEPPSA